MKKFITPIILIALCATFSVSAKVITVSNAPNSPGQYTSLQTAIDSANAGDTIYVHGSSTSYGNVTIEKRIILLGTGHNPSKTNPLVSEIGNIQLDTISGVSGASGTKIAGFKLNRVSGYAGVGGTKNIIIQRNYFISSGTKISITGAGWAIENNIISSSTVNANNHSTIVFRNNIFNSSYISTSNQSTVLVVNNIFLGSTSALSTVSNALIANNIFSGSTPNGMNVNANTFSNNITYQTTSDIIPIGTNTGSGNFVAQNPQFMNVPTNSFNYSYDFSLDTISPGINAGTDGTDIGAYGGSMPFVDMTGSPAIPQMKFVTILNPVIPVGDSLNIIIKAKKQN